MLCEHGNIAPCAECDVYPLEEELKDLKFRIGYLEMIASSILHGHEQSVVDWDAFKALQEYFKEYGK